jgi:alginate O-acetyltransferase complex protein AlgI
MAIGLGKMFGFHFTENFHYPYISTSIREFWRRWHISLSTWFRDYLYIPLGGNHKGARRTCINLLIVFFVCGLWHGPSWTFVIWGLWHGLFLITERYRFGGFVASNRIVGLLYTLLVVSIGWVFFRSDTLVHAIHYLSAMAGMGKGNLSASVFLDLKTTLTILLGVVGCSPIGEKLSSFSRGDSYASDTFVGRMMTRGSTLLYLAYIYFVFLLSVVFISSDTHNPFIYFRF